MVNEGAGNVETHVDGNGTLLTVGPASPAILIQNVDLNNVETNVTNNTSINGQDVSSPGVAIINLLISGSETTNISGNGFVSSTVIVP